MREVIIHRQTDIFLQFTEFLSQSAAIVMERISIANEYPTRWILLQNRVRRMNWAEEWVQFGLECAILDVGLQADLQESMRQNGLVQAGKQTWSVVIVVEV